MINKAYLISVITPERYALFLRGSFFVLGGYLIATVETFIAIYLGFTTLTYDKTIYISLSIISFSSTLTLVTYIKKDLKYWQEWAIFMTYLITFLCAFSLWVYWLDELRFLGILNAVTAVAIVVTYTNFLQSLLMSIPTLICYYITTWYAIKIAGQPGSLAKETFLSLCLFPGFLLISSAAYYINRKRKDLQKVTSTLGKLNDDLSGAYDKLKKEQELTGIEMDLARGIQRALFPGKPPLVSDWDIAFITEPYGAVSGDFYDFYTQGNSLKGISLFDVSGHGVAPALITILIRPVLYSNFIRPGLSGLGEVVDSVNGELYSELEDVDIYITGILLRMNGPCVEYVNAGHPDMLLFDPVSKSIRVITDDSDSFKGYPVGILRSDYKYPFFEFSISKGEFLVLYTDGLIESQNPSGERYGFEGLTSALVSSLEKDSAGILKDIVESFNRFLGDRSSEDDITIIIAGKT
jgi:serine phosphatase RsbU (regulator of sigma subunit)